VEPPPRRPRPRVRRRDRPRRVQRRALRPAVHAARARDPGRDGHALGAEDVRHPRAAASARQRDVQARLPMRAERRADQVLERTRGNPHGGGGSLGRARGLLRQRRAHFVRFVPQALVEASGAAGWMHRFVRVRVAGILCVRVIFLIQ